MSEKQFDFCIGNPPYQEQNDSNGRQPPVYNTFMDAAETIADTVELITPARFLFDAGQTPKSWNKKKLNDPHFKVLKYESDAGRVFPNTEIKGGVAITIRNQNKDYGSIKIFTDSTEMNSVLHKVINLSKDFISSIVVGAVPYHFTDEVKVEHPEYIDDIPESFDLRTNVLDKLDGKLFFDMKPSKGDYTKIYGLHNKRRAEMWIDTRYITKAKNFIGYKVLISKASGAGKFGEALSDPIIAGVKEGHTQSFISIGDLSTEQEAYNLESYLKTKFFRAMLSILKKTQDLNPDKFKYVPLQDFTSSSDIDWSKSISDIDKQLYKKYGLSQDEIDFIETHVKEMA